MAVLPLKLHRIDARQQSTKVAQIWQSLQAECTHNFFLSWSWLEHWLNALPQAIHPEFFWFTPVSQNQENEEIVGACFVTSKTGFEYGFVFAKRGWLNETGEHNLDELCIENHGILTKEGYEIACLQSLINDASDIDHFELDRCRLIKLEDQIGSDFILEQKTRSGYCVDLKQIRESEDGLLGLISRNKRAQIRAALRAYQQLGEIRIETASSSEEREAFFNKLIEYHQQSWQKRGAPGVFSNPFFLDFHRSLIEQTAGDGTTELVRISAGDTDIGIFYLFCYQGVVHYYQSGICYLPKNVYKPGLLAHHLLAQKYANAGFQFYDLMSGDDHYKRGISTEQYPIASSVICRNKKRFRMLNFMRQCKKNFTEKFTQGHQ